MKCTLTLAIACTAGPALATGFQFVEVPATGTQPPIEAAVWYPTDAAVPETPNTPFGQAVAMHAPVAGEGLPVVVLSHGDGGWFGGHAALARALAEAGMVAVALNHPGNSDGDESAPPSEWIAERPRHLARVVAHVTGPWGGAAHLDAARIGAFGFSAGGHSVLAAAGLGMSHERLAAHCADTPGEFACASGMAAEVIAGAQDLPPPLPHLRAVVAVAPGFGFGFDAAELAGLDLAVQLWSGADDARVPHATNAAPLAAALSPPSEAHLVADAGHFAFRPPCNPALQEANPRLWEMACVDAPGFDRAAFQERFTAEVTGFLAARLAP